MYGKQLEEHIKSEISGKFFLCCTYVALYVAFYFFIGKFLTGVLALLVPSEEYDAKCVREAIKVKYLKDLLFKRPLLNLFTSILKGAGTNEKVLIQTLCPKEAFEIEKIKRAYKKRK